MKIIINIPDDKYKEICSGNFETDGYFKMNLRDAFRNGIPLPKGHGDLKDADKLKDAFITWSAAVQGNFTDADIANIVCNSTTIIEADKAESGDRE